MIDIRPLKETLKKQFPRHVLTKLLEVEPDLLSDDEFVFKMPTYIKLAHKSSDSEECSR